jgi:hypothetical protein
VKLIYLLDWLLSKLGLIRAARIFWNKRHPTQGPHFPEGFDYQDD